MAAVKQKMSRDKYLKEKAAAGFFLTQVDPITGSEFEIDEDTVEDDVAETVPIKFMFVKDHDMVCNTTQIYVVDLHEIE